MRIYLPYVNLNVAVEKAIELFMSGDCDVLTIVNVSKSDHAYFDLLCELWSKQQDFIVIEQDIVINETTIATLAQCKNDWCAYTYPYLNGVYAGLGCTKFSASIQARNPNLFERVAQKSNINHPPKHWCTLDQWITTELVQAGNKQCIHNPPLVHLRETQEVKPTHGCC